MKLRDCAFTMTAVLFGIGLVAAVPYAPIPQAPDPTPPDNTVKLIFIHHSTGRNWLADEYGGLGKTLAQNNYFVSDANYGWGPDAIGDRTDIPDWPEWFASNNSPIYMDALFNESNQHVPYSRTLADPGGENEIIMFKSCFPNSALEGSPNDPPGTYAELSVSGAKYVYNTILQFFATRPDKLFIVITAPPLSDDTNAENARAFNNWLVNDWLDENNYTLNNVAVFDFYNILTDPNAHHRFHNGQVEHIAASSNTLYYPSGFLLQRDDHPSEEGSRKATEEFVPLLNIFYHNWKENAPTEPISPKPNQPESAPLPPTSSLIAGFESGEPPWEAFHDETTSSTMTCQFEADTGRNGNSLLLNFDLTPNSWGTCARFFETSHNWSAAEGISFYASAGAAGSPFDIDLYAGPNENRETYLATLTASTEWTRFELRWDDFQRASWEENAGAPFAKQGEVTGIAFGFGTPADTLNAGILRVDDLSLLSTEPELSPEPVSEDPEPAAKNPFFCFGVLILPLAAVLPLLRKIKRPT